MATQTQTNDWFVAADAAPRGDGSRTTPFHDPWLALRRAEPGDTIHIAAGTYYGRFDRSSWIVDCPNLTVRGGYSRDFTARAPWKTPSVLAFYAGYEAGREPNLITGRDDHSGLVLDGLFFDSAGRNTYGPKPGDGISRIPNMEGPMASFSSENVVIRNCIFTNSANGGVELSGSGSRFENNLLLNMLGPAMLHLRSSSRPIDTPITVAGNTFCFMHDDGDPPGGGGDRSLGIRIYCSAVIQDNVFVACGNSAIGALIEPSSLSVQRNLFFVTPHSIFETRNSGNTWEISEKNLDEAEDLGFQSFEANAVQDPAVSGLNPAWLDTYSRHLLGRYATPPRDAGNALRATAGLPPLTPADLTKEEQKGALAPPLAVGDALALAFGAKPGAHPVDLDVRIAPPTAQPALEYRSIEWNSLLAPDTSLNNQRVQLRAGLGFEQNSYLLDDAGPDTHMGIRIYQPGSDDNSLYVLIRRNSFPTRQYREATLYTRGMEVEKTYYLRGIFRAPVNGTLQKSTIIVESIAPAPLLTRDLPARPAGRDWFVRAGATGGDGTREKPFRDPFQPLEKAQPGDTIHVAGGDYFGKLRSGKWTLAAAHLSLLGGYDAQFATRDPKVNPTRFLLDPEQKAKGRPDGTILSSQENSDGLILDGFVFDGTSWNTYKDGNLDYANSPLAPLISLRGLNAPIIVRNCVFLNAYDGALQVSCPLAVIEDNVIQNTSGDALTLRADGPGPAVIRNNIILIARDPTQRAATGKSTKGTLLQLTGRASITIEGNILGYADYCAIRATLPQENITLRNNIIGGNRYKDLTDANYLWADSATWDRRVVADSGYTVEGNRLQLPEVPKLDTHPPADIDPGLTTTPDVVAQSSRSASS